MGINYWAILVCAVLAMIIGSVWYGPIFGNAWMKLCGMHDMDEAKKKEMQKKMMPLYLVQFLLTLFQVFILAHLTGATPKSGIISALLVWGGFVLPTVAASSMWTNDSKKVAWTRFGIQAGYQVVCFVITR